MICSSIRLSQSAAESQVFQNFQKKSLLKIGLSLKMPYTERQAKRNYLVVFFAVVALTSNCSADGDAHSHSHAATSSTDSKDGSTTGTLTSTTTTTSSDDGGDAISSILSSFAKNPQAAAAAASAARSAGAGYHPPPPPPTGGYDYPPPPAQPTPGVPIPGGNYYHGGFPGGFPGLGGYPGLGGFFPGFGFGKSLNLNVDAGVGGYFPIIEKVIVVIGGGILILLIIAFIQGSMSAGGFLNSLGAGFSNALAGAGSVDVNLGPIHKSASAAGALNVGAGINPPVGPPPIVNDPRFNGQVQQAINQRF